MFPNRVGCLYCTQRRETQSRWVLSSLATNTDQKSVSRELYVTFFAIPIYFTMLATKKVHQHRINGISSKPTDNRPTDVESVLIMTVSTRHSSSGGSLPLTRITQTPQPAKTSYLNAYVDTASGYQLSSARFL